MMKLFKINMFFSLVYFLIGFFYIEDGVVLTIISLLFGSGIMFACIVYLNLKRKRYQSKVISKERIKSELSGKSSRSFRYIFRVGNINYEMPEDFRFGGIEYKIGDEVMVFLNEETNTVLPRQVLIIFTMLSIVFVVLSVLLLLRG